MIPTRIRALTAAGGFGNPQRMMTNGPKNNSVFWGVAGLVGLTSMIYWMGYRDMENRHSSQAPKTPTR